VENEKPNAIIRKCHCVHSAQDLLHGKGRRIFNVSQLPRSTTAYCSVCGATISITERAAPVQHSRTTSHVGGKKAGLKGRKKSKAKK
jgi:hypothetical protein